MCLQEKVASIGLAQDTPGITLVRPMETFGDDDCPKGHMEILFEAVLGPLFSDH